MVNDKGIIKRLERYWELLRKDSNIPEIQKLNSSAVEDVWSQCFMLSVNTRRGLAYKYEYMGEVIAHMYGHDLTGMTVDYRMKQFPGSAVLEKLDKVITLNKPFTDNGHLLNDKGQMVKYRACFLPFGNTKKGLTHIVAGLSFRTF